MLRLCEWRGLSGKTFFAGCRRCLQNEKSPLGTVRIRSFLCGHPLGLIRLFHAAVFLSCRGLRGQEKKDGQVLCVDKDGL